ncbi:hypothetical protein MKW94_008611 [Papaver nudicaule]|uniref:Ataxin-10 domain-containing protein n=1 Tax=Papaver nudicaule TaxID=74823 RepID=A0AA42AX33_PAPNU|nr:hypothetical protein [Papaver nudicaule]
MEEKKWPTALVIPEYIRDPILHAAYSSRSDEALEFYQLFHELEALVPCKAPIGVENALDMLIEATKIDEGRSKPGSTKVLPVVVNLVRFLISAGPLPTHYPLYLSLKLLRNLCGGEIRNQNCFIEVDGVDVVARAIDSVKGKRNHGLQVLLTGLQLLGNVCRAGGEHKNVVWYRFFPGIFKNMAKCRERDVVDVLCMVVHTCCDGCYEIMGQLYGVQGVQLVAEIVGTSRYAGGDFEEWLLELLEITCIKGSYFKQLFKELKMRSDLSIENAVNSFKKLEDLKVDEVKIGHVYLLKLIFWRLDSKKRLEPNVSKEFALSILHLFNKVGVSFFSKSKSGLISISTLDIRLRKNSECEAELLNWSIKILYALYSHDLKVICSPGGSSSTAEDSVFELLLSSGLDDQLLYFLHELGSPVIKKFSMSGQPGVCPYLGFHNHIVEFIGYCLDGRRHVQDEFRQKGAILLLLQQCCEDEDNLLLRPTGLKAVVKLLDGNRENQQAVISLMKDKNVYVPKLTGPGGLTIDRETARVTLKDLPTML